MPVLCKTEEKLGAWGHKLSSGVRKIYCIRYIVSDGSCTDLEGILSGQDSLDAGRFNDKKREAASVSL